MHGLKANHREVHVRDVIEIQIYTKMFVFVFIVNAMIYSNEKETRQFLIGLRIVINLVKI